MSRVVVVGSGIAGLTAALRASQHHSVTLVTKAELAESNTRYAQGGIAAALFRDDSIASHVADTVAAAAGLGDRHIAEVLCSEGPARVRELISLGVGFDRAADGSLSRGHEAAHSNRRVIHARGDATGLAIELALVAAVRAADIEILEHTFLDDLVVQEARVSGVSVVASGSDVPGPPMVIDADFVILASGGAGQLYTHTTNPAIATGDGVGAALRAGAVLGDLEFYQFHPTSLAVPGNPLVSEAVRGEGAVLRSTSGERFLFAVHPDGELAPRDIVARGIAAQMSLQDGEPVLLDATNLERDFLSSRFPGIASVTAAHGFDWAAEPIPVTPAAHYWMGGIRTDDSGRTTIRGLLAVGEVACTGAHGANRLASNSLLEALVFAARAALAIDSEWTPFNLLETQDLQRTALPLSSETGSASVVIPEFPKGQRVNRRALQQLMWKHVGLYRSADGLRDAAAVLAKWSAGGESILERENRNLLDIARVMVYAASTREESRGSHFRSDFPAASDQFVRHLEYRAAVRERVNA